MAAEARVLSLLRIVPQSLKARLVVTTMEPHSYRFEMTWKRSSAPCLSTGREPSSSITRRLGGGEVFMALDVLMVWGKEKSKASMVLITRRFAWEMRFLTRLCCLAAIS